MPSADMLVDPHEPQQPVVASQRPKAPLEPRPSTLSPVVARHKDQFQEFIARRQATLPPIEHVPPLPGNPDSLTEALAPMTQALNHLVTGVNEMRANLVTRNDLVEFRELQSEEIKAVVTAHYEPLREAVVELQKGQVVDSDRIGRLETRVENAESGGTNFDKVRKQLLDESDPAFKQIAFTGFKDSGSASALQKRIDALRTFASTNFADKTIANIEVIKNGPWKQRKPTGTVVMEFFSRDTRDEALEIAKAKSVYDSGTKLDLKIDRARTRAQRARNWALRKAEELAKIEASKLGIPGAGRIDFTMPVRKVFVGNVLAFQQKRDELRGEFVSAFSTLALPP